MFRKLPAALPINAPFLPSASERGEIPALAKAEHANRNIALSTALPGLAAYLPNAQNEEVSGRKFTTFLKIFVSFFCACAPGHLFFVRFFDQQPWLLGFFLRFIVQNSSGEVTRLLQAWTQGDADARDQLMELVYRELHQLAARELKREQFHYSRDKPHTLFPTELVNEAFLRLTKQDRMEWQNRGHFFAIASTAMRHALTDHARARLAAKRGKDITLVSLHEEVAKAESREAIEILALDEALDRLAKKDARKVQIVEMRFLGGLTAEEIAELLETTPHSIRSQWRFAKAWLFRELGGQTQ